MRAENVAGFTRQEFEIMRQDAKQKFQDVQNDWIEQLLWTVPNRARWMINRNSDVPMGYPIADGTHILAHRSFVAGFMEGNTSASRPWIRYSHPDPDRNLYGPNRTWLDLASRRVHDYLSNSNFYNEAGQFYYDFGAVNTGAHIFKKVGNSLHVWTLMPGSYFVINNALGENETMVREFALHAVALVKRFGKKKDGDWDWSNFSDRVKRLFDRSDTTVMIECVEVLTRNKNFSSMQPIGGSNRQWVSAIYETGVCTGDGFAQYASDATITNDTYLEVTYSRRKPFIVGRSHGSSPYGDQGPTSLSIGLIRSLNKKAISKDIAIEKMLDPTTQGPAHIRKSYLTTQARRHIPLDATSLAQGGLKTVYEIPQGIVALTSDVEDIRRQVEKFYFADFLLYLTNNPKTRTAEETRAIVQEQQSVIGPNLQTLNWSYNQPIAEYMLDFIIAEDPYMPPPPEDLAGQWINTQFTSVFSSVQRAFDLPQINQYTNQIMGIAQLNPQAWNLINLQKLNQVYEDRYYLPSGLANPKSAVQAMIRQAQEQQQRQQMIEALPAAASASRDMAQAQQIQGGGGQGV